MLLCSDDNLYNAKIEYLKFTDVMISQIDMFKSTAMQELIVGVLTVAQLVLFQRVLICSLIKLGMFGDCQTST